MDHRADPSKRVAHRRIGRGSLRGTRVGSEADQSGDSAPARSRPAAGRPPIADQPGQFRAVERGRAARGALRQRRHGISSDGPATWAARTPPCQRRGAQLLSTAQRRAGLRRTRRTVAAAPSRPAVTAPFAGPGTHSARKPHSAAKAPRRSPPLTKPETAAGQARGPEPRPSPDAAACAPSAGVRGLPSQAPSTRRAQLVLSPDRALVGDEVQLHDLAGRMGHPVRRGRRALLRPEQARRVPLRSRPRSRP